LKALLEASRSTIVTVVVAGSSSRLLVASARALVDAHAPSRDEWPNTLFGRLFAEGVLTDDMGYRNTEDGDWELVPSAQITFQRFADYRIATSMVASLKTAAELQAALAVGKPLRAQVSEARTGIIEALAVLLPERFGVELLDAARWNLQGHRAARWHRATLESIASRRDDAATPRTAELLRDISGRSRALFEAATGTLLAVAARPDHALNAEFLHASLTRWSMAERDAAWSIITYRGLDERGPLDRLVRWAAAGPSRTIPTPSLSSRPSLWCGHSARRIASCATTSPRFSASSYPSAFRSCRSCSIDFGPSTIPTSFSAWP
jgi:hypothetical protein